MVISVETTLQHPRRGFIKLEDTVAVTDTGFEIYGEGGRGWNRAGPGARAKEIEQDSRFSPALYPGAGGSI